MRGEVPLPLEPSDANAVATTASNRVPKQPPVSKAAAAKGSAHVAVKAKATPVPAAPVARITAVPTEPTTASVDAPVGKPLVSASDAAGKVAKRMRPQQLEAAPAAVSAVEVVAPPAKKQVAQIHSVADSASALPALSDVIDTRADLLPWPAAVSATSKQDFDILACGLHPHDAAQFQLLLRDRARYNSLDAPAWRMLPRPSVPGTKSRQPKASRKFLEWFSEERLEEQPDFLVNYKPLSTPERVCLDFQLYSIMERVVGGPSQASQDGSPAPPELSSIINPPSLKDIRVDAGQITLPMSVSLIRERIQRQQYHSVRQ